MKKLVFIIVLLLFGGIAFCQTLTPKVCWSFDGRNTDMKEIVLVYDFVMDMSEMMQIPSPIKIALGQVNQPIAFIDKNNERWIITPANRTIDYSPEGLKRQNIDDTHFVFLLSLHDLETTTPFKTPKDILKVDENMPNVEYRMKKRKSRFDDSKAFISGYQSLTDSTTLIYPRKAERLGTFMFAFSAYHEEHPYNPDDDYDEKRVADSIAEAEEAKAKLAAEADMKAKLKILTKIKCTPTSHNFDKVEIGQKLTYTFLVKNIGKEDLNIFNVSRDYYTTDIEYCKGKTIKPNETCSIIASWTPSERERGEAIKNFIIMGNFEGGKEKVLKLTGEVVEKNKE